ncbi:MAG: hypothetical protein M0D57_10620 [Sphingobacteriales bacterium JAD_PAG50586_3]|nr:MAG: hypothetical protein M0D57_10620 [Sphingobacteriales bacterium JAD_PAG50586_3]
MNAQQKNIMLGRISNAIGQDNIDRFHSLGINKYGVILSLKELIDVIKIDFDGLEVKFNLQGLEPYQKIYFFEDYYYYKSFYKENIGWGIGKDPDRREYFEPYEE